VPAYKPLDLDLSSLLAKVYFIEVRMRKNGGQDLLYSNDSQ
jgi:hypothetical protein